MRIVAGEWRGRRLVAPAGRATRPTSDRVREALFSAVESLAMRGEVSAPRPGPGLDRATPPDAGTASGFERQAGLSGGGPLAAWTVLDLFAGSGALGLEALSRGAASCTFVERDAAALKALRANLAALGCAPPRVRVTARDALRAAQADARVGNAYTLVLVDAPYAAYEALERGLTGLVTALVAPGGLVAVETARGQPVKLPLQEVAVKTYGGTQVTYLTRKVPCQRT